MDMNFFHSFTFSVMMGGKGKRGLEICWKGKEKDGEMFPPLLQPPAL